MDILFLFQTKGGGETFLCYFFKLAIYVVRNKTDCESGKGSTLSSLA